MPSRDITYCAYGDKCKNEECERRGDELHPNDIVSWAYYDDCEDKPEEYKPKEEK